MKKTKALLPSVFALTLLTTLAIGCGSSDTNPPSQLGYAAPAASPSPSASGSLTIQTATNSMGTYITDGTGRSFYVFEADTPNAGTSACSGACATAWPPVLVASGQTPSVSPSISPSPAPSASASPLVGTFRRSDGTTQVMYAGMPLYYYSGDTLAGQTNGEGLNQFGALWYLIQPNGQTLR